MNCDDAREAFSRGGMGLTERALVHAHVMQCVECRTERESLPPVVSCDPRVTPSPAARLTRLRARLAISSTRSGQATVRAFDGARVGITRVFSAFVTLTARAAAHVIGTTRSGMTIFVERLARFRALPSMASTVLGQAVARQSGAVRFGITHSVHLSARLRALLASASTAFGRAAVRAARAAIETAGGGVTRALDSLIRLRAPLSISIAVSARTAGRAIAAGRVGALRGLDLVIRVRGRVRGPVRALPAFARSARAAVEAIGARWAVARVVMTPSSRVRPLLKVCAGIVSVAVLLAALLAAWPRPWWPDDLRARFSAGERLSRDVRRSVDRPPVEPAAAAPAAAAPLVQTTAPRPVSAAQPATRTEIPAPSRRPDPALARIRATASAPILPTEAVQSAEASDSTAAIDWLLKGGSGRRSIETP